MLPPTGRPSPSAASRAGDIRLAGKAEDVDLTIQGAGEIHVENLEVTGEVETSIQGVGKIYRDND